MSDEAMQVLKDELAKVNAKNAELIGEIRDQKKALKKFDELDIEGLQEAAKKLEKAEIDKKKEVGEFKTLYESELTKTSELSNQVAALSDNNANLAKRLEVNQHLPNVFPELREIAVSQLVKDLGIGEDGSVKSPDGKSAKEYVAAWAESDVGKRFIQADVNSGGNASGSNSGGKNAELAYFKPGDPNFSMTKQAEIRKKDPELAEKLAKQAKGR